jgi:hypothetical protein
LRELARADVDRVARIDDDEARRVGEHRGVDVHGAARGGCAEAGAEGEA